MARGLQCTNSLFVSMLQVTGIRQQVSQAAFESQVRQHTEWKPRVYQDTGKPLGEVQRRLPVLSLVGRANLISP